MKAVIFFSGLAGLILFGPPVIKPLFHKHEVSVIVHEIKHEIEAEIQEELKHEFDHQSWDSQDRCRYEAERTASSSGSVDALRLTAGSGFLEVVGVEGLREVRAVARACASHEEFLDDLLLLPDMAGNTFILETHYPDFSGWRGGNRYARLDLRVEFPAGLAADIEDGSGEISISDLGSLMLDDGSGEVVINGIRGDLTIDDGSGELEIRGVSGTVSLDDGSGEIVLVDVGSDVMIDDSSGEIEVRGVGGSIELRDSSGEIDVQDVIGNVRVLSDSSGDIQVEGVGGDFIVDRDGSGSIQHEAVQGTVDIPKKKGRR